MTGTSTNYDRFHKWKGWTCILLQMVKSRTIEKSFLPLSSVLLLDFVDIILLSFFKIVGAGNRYFYTQRLFPGYRPDYVPHCVNSEWSQRGLSTIFALCHRVKWCGDKTCYGIKIDFEFWITHLIHLWSHHILPIFYIVAAPIDIIFRFLSQQRGEIRIITIAHIFLGLVKSKEIFIPFLNSSLFWKKVMLRKLKRLSPWYTMVPLPILKP